MKKNLMTLAAVFCCIPVTMMAEPVSPSAARQAAAKFLQGKGAMLQGEAMRAPRRAMGRAADNQEATVASPYYVFNATASQGFVIVSGDDCVGDNLVLGYTSQGSFDAEAIPDNMQWWMDEMATQISELSRFGVKARAVALHDDVPHLVTASWDQGRNSFNPQNPYNALCPETDGRLCLTGCMATALSQVLYYYRWPQGPIGGDLPAYTTCNGRMMEALPATSFDWDDMVDSYNQPTTETQQMAVAKLMRYCGQLIQMDYTPQVSNGYAYDVDLLVNLFGFDQGVYTAKANDYTVSGWDELLYNELKEGRPLVYAGRSTGAGHAFVIDGYEVSDGSGYFYVNWGWNGDGNGFYKISLLNPDTSGAGGSTTKDGYSREQQALIGLQPAKSATVNYGRYLTSLMWNGVEDDVLHTFDVLNSSYKPGVFGIAMAERNPDGETDYDHLYGEQTLEVTGYSFAGLNSETHSGLEYFLVPKNVAEGLAPGSHKFVFVNKEVGTDAPWKPIFGPNCYVEIIVDDEGEPTDTLFHPLPQLTSNTRAVKIEGLKQRGIRQEITVTITNNGDDDFISGLKCSMYLVENNVLKALANVAYTGIMIEAGGTADVMYSLSAPTAGNYVVVITTDEKDLSGTNLTRLKQQKGYIVHRTFSVDELAFYCQDIAYNERPDEKGDPAYYLDVILANRTTLDYDAVLLARLYKLNDEGNFDYFEFPTTPNLYTDIQVNSNMRLATSIQLPEALEPNYYIVELRIANDFHSRIPSDYFALATGVIKVEDTVGIDEMENGKWGMEEETAPWFSLDGHKLDSQPSAKGVYIHKGKKYIVK